MLTRARAQALVQTRIYYKFIIDTNKNRIKWIKNKTKICQAKRRWWKTIYAASSGQSAHSLYPSLCLSPCPSICLHWYFIEFQQNTVFYRLFSMPIFFFFFAFLANFFPSIKDTNFWSVAHVSFTSALGACFIHSVPLLHNSPIENIVTAASNSLQMFQSRKLAVRGGTAGTSPKLRT